MFDAKQIYLKQGTKAWHNFRFEHIGSSDAGIIIGDVHPMETDTEYELLDRKVKKQHRMVSGRQLTHMRRGLTLESDFLGYYHLKYELENTFVPAVFESKSHPFMGASLDGCNEEEGIILEIKSTTNRRQHMLVRNGEIPPYHYPQLQHQLLTTGAYEARYLSFYDRTLIGDDDNNHHRRNINLAELRVKLDNEYCNRLLEAEEKFWDEYTRRRHQRDSFRTQRDKQDFG